MRQDLEIAWMSTKNSTELYWHLTDVNPSLHVSCWRKKNSTKMIACTQSDFRSYFVAWLIRPCHVYTPYWLGILAKCTGCPQFFTPAESPGTTVVDFWPPLSCLCFPYSCWLSRQTHWEVDTNLIWEVFKDNRVLINSFYSTSYSREAGQTEQCHGKSCLKGR